MQNPLSYQSIRNLFIPVDPMLLEAEQSSQSNILSFNSEERKAKKGKQRIDNYYANQRHNQTY